VEHLPVILWQEEQDPLGYFYRFETARVDHPLSYHLVFLEDLVSQEDRVRVVQILYQMATLFHVVVPLH
jgi:hypothetical protein